MTEYKPARQKKKKRVWLWLTAGAVALVACITLFVSNYVNPIIFAASEGKVKSAANIILNTSVYETITGNVYDNLVKFKTDSNGKISLIETDSIKLNILAQNLLNKAIINTEKYSANGLDIPVGTLTGIPLFSGRGTNIKIKLMPIGNYGCNFTSEFVSAGINQTIHKIGINFNCTISLVMPGEVRRIPVSVSMVVAESIIVGDVPATYLGGEKQTLVSIGV